MDANVFDQAAARNALNNLEAAERALRLIAPREREPDPRWQRLMRSYSERDAVLDLMHERRSGVHREVHEEIARSQPPTRPNSLLYPWERLSTRADTAASDGSLVQSLTFPAADAMRTRMPVGRLGASILQAPYGANVSQPKQVATAIPQWLTNETTAVTESDQSFGQVVYSPKTVAAYTEVSRLLTIQTGIDAVIRRDLGAVIARAADYGATFSDGTGGSPLGIAHTAGINTFVGTAATGATFVDAATGLGVAFNETTGIATTLLVAGACRKRLEIPGVNRTLWEGPLTNGQIAGLPAASSTAYPAANVLLGSWEYETLVFYGAPEIQVNPYDRANFQSGVVGVRIFLTMDAQPTWPAAFALATNFS